MKHRFGWGSGLALSGFLIFSVPTGPETLPLQLLHHKKGGTSEAFGSSVAGVGDVNGDGNSDFIAGSYRASPNELFEAGSAFVYSGLDGSVLYQADGTTGGEWLGYSVAGGGDVDGDGRADFIVGAPHADSGTLFQAGKVCIYSGRTGDLLGQIFGEGPSDHMGTSVGIVGDLDSDGKDDFICGAPGANPNDSVNAGSAYVYSGAGFTLLKKINGTAKSDFLGTSVSGAGDVNGDGVPDYIIGAPYAEDSVNRSINLGAAFIYSGQDDSLLFVVWGDSADEYLGFSVAGAGDIDQDGRSDVIIGAPNSAGALDVGRAAVFSGAGGSLLFQFTGDSAKSLFGWSVDGTGDVDGDGWGDFVVGAVNAKPGGLTYAGSAFVYSGADGSPLVQVDGLAPFDEMGYSVSGAGDVNADGLGDFVVSALLADSGKGAVFVYGLVATGTPEEKYNRPARFKLSQNYPNPFNPATTIRYSLSKREKVALEIFNLAGQRAKILAAEEQAAGEHTTVWDGKDERGKTLPSGIYFYRLRGEGFSETKKMLFLK